MLSIKDTSRPVFCGRKDRKRIRQSAEIVCEDATGIVIAMVAGMAAVLVLGLLAGSWVREWMM